MRALSTRSVAAAAALSAIAGFVDAVAFITLGGFFVSFMSGNTTRSSVGLASSGVWVPGLALIGSFVAGVMISTVAGRRFKARAETAVLLMVGVLLAAAAALADIVLAPPLAYALVLAAAMGAMNTVFARGGETSFGLTYMTGSLVKLGQGIVGALTGGPRWLWTRYLALWAAISAGAIAGTIAYSTLGLHALWIPVAVVLAGIPVALRMRRSPRRD